METSSVDIARLNNALVDQLKSAGIIVTPSVEAAFRAVPRHLFVPDVPLDQVYRDQVIVTKRSAGGAPTSSCEQPAIVAVMLEQLEAQPGDKILEIGTGTGHVAAMLAHLVGPTGQVTTIDIQPELVELAREHLTTAGFPKVKVVCADGGYGYPEGAPYDRIILTVGSSDIPPAWQEQLRVGGRLVLPLFLMPGSQLSVAFEKMPTRLVTLSQKPCGFMPLQGAFAAEAPQDVELASEPGLRFGLDHGGPVDAPAIYRLLTGPSRRLATDISLSGHDVFSGLGPWIALKESNGCGLQVQGDWLNRGGIPCILGIANQFGGTGGLVDGSERLALLARPPDRPLPADWHTPEPPILLHVLSYGPDDALGEQLIRQAQAWDQAGRPTLDQARVTAYPRDIDPPISTGEYLLTRPSLQLVLHWTA